MQETLKTGIGAACEKLFAVRTDVELTRPEPQFGDFATNVALKLAKQVAKNPREVAEDLAEQLRQTLEQVKDVSVAGPGFLNLTLTDEALLESLDAAPAQSYAGREVLVEFGDPNPFKAMHIGHLYSYIVGDAISSLLEAAGADVKRLSYHGDVGLHVAKAIWAMRQDPDALNKDDVGAFYAAGSKAYAEDGTAKAEIDDINVKVYAGDASIRELYERGRERSFAGFDRTLQELGIRTDQRYLESASTPVGTEMVRQNTGSVFTKSDGAIVYEGEKAGLHTRVFITGKGLPTYEAKDLGLTSLKDRDYPKAALSVIITAHEQAEYFKVMLAALAEIKPETAAKTQHLSHGFVSLSTGKMSSRTGDVYGADDLLHDVAKFARQQFPDAAHEVELGAVKYAFARHRLGGDIVYDIGESVSLEGNSGPYLQYAHARARSVLRKAGGNGSLEDAGDLELDERLLARKLGEYAGVVDRAVAELMPHHVCTYLYELAQEFNRFYEKNRVIGDPRSRLRLALVRRYAETLQSGLAILGMVAPDKM